MELLSRRPYIRNTLHPIKSEYSPRLVYKLQLIDRSLHFLLTIKGVLVLDAQGHEKVFAIWLQGIRRSYLQIHF